MTSKQSSWLACDWPTGRHDRGGVLESRHPNGVCSALCLGSGIKTKTVLFSTGASLLHHPQTQLGARPCLTVHLGETPKPKWPSVLIENSVCWRERGWESVKAEGFAPRTCTSGFRLWNSNTMSFLFLSPKHIDSCLRDSAPTFSTPQEALPNTLPDVVLAGSLSLRPQHFPVASNFSTRFICFFTCQLHEGMKFINMNEEDEWELADGTGTAVTPRQMEIRRHAPSRSTAFTFRQEDPGDRILI